MTEKIKINKFRVTKPVTLIHVIEDEQGEPMGFAIGSLLPMHSIIEALEEAVRQLKSNPHTKIDMEHDCEMVKEP